MNKNNLSLALSSIALVIASAAGGPAIARAIVPNADKVDGIDAVKSTATVKARKGKLVATSPKTGRLPNNIIAMAPNSAKLGGFTAAQLGGVQLFAGAAEPAQGAEPSGGGAISFPGDSTTSNAIWTFVVPADYKAGKTLSMDFYLARSDDAACNMMLYGQAGIGPVNGDQLLVPVNVAGSNSPAAVVSFPAQATVLTVVKRTVSVTSAQLKPGMFFAVSIGRDDTSVLDTCTGVVLLVAGHARY